MLKDGSGNTLLTGQGSDLAKGISDIAALVKYRFVTFEGGGFPDPGGVALLVTMRLPTGDTDNLRGLGNTRTMATLIISGGKAKFRPHVNGGFEYWSKGLSVTSDNPPNSTVTARHEVQYAAGFEVEAAPKLTVLLDFLGAHTLGGGRLGLRHRALPRHLDLRWWSSRFDQRHGSRIGTARACERDNGDGQPKARGQ